LDKGKIGENYILGGSDVALQTMLGDIAFLSTAARPTENSARPPFPLAWGAEAVARVTGQGAFSHHGCLAHVALSHVLQFRESQARTGLRARPYIEGLKDALGWFRDNGYLK
jgi:dihydroflavonol-4-reductase